MTTDFEKSVAAKMDQNAADLKFLENIEEYTLADLNDKAPQHIRERLRSAKFCKDWSRALGIFCAKTQNPQMRKKIAEHRSEAAALKRKFTVIQMGEMASIHVQIKNDIGIDFSGRSSSEMQILLLVEILKELRK